MTGESGKRRADAGKGEPAASAAITVGGYANAYCGKCKEVTSHIVLAKVGIKPTRVECRTCHAMHAFKAAASSRTTSTRSPRTAEPNPQEAWNNAMRSARGETVPYVTSGRFGVGQRLKHATFGEGVVARLSSGTVCEVVFSHGTVKLIMGASGQGPGR